MLLGCVSLHGTECLAAPVPWLLEEGDALETSSVCVDLLPRLGIQLDWGEELWLFVVHIPAFSTSFELPVSKGIEGIWAKGPPAWGMLCLGWWVWVKSRCAAPWRAKERMWLGNGCFVECLELELCVQNSAGII